MKSFLFYNLVFLCFSFAALASSPKQEYYRYSRKQFDLPVGGTVYMSNKYGKVNVSTWDKNEVKFDIRISVNAENDKKAEEIFNRIHIVFSNGSNWAKAETQFDKENNKANVYACNGKSADYQIDYDVTIPKSAMVDLKNAYGDAMVSSIDGAATIQIQYGNIKMEDIGKKLDMKLEYSNGQFGHATATYCMLRYSNLKGENTADFNLDSKYSKVNLDKAGKVLIAGQYDQYNFSDLNSLQYQGSYSGIKIKTVNTVTYKGDYCDLVVNKLNEATLDLKYGRAKISELPKNFGEIKMNGNYADFQLMGAGDADFTLDFNGKYASVKYPERFKSTLKSENSSVTHIQGKTGDGKPGNITATLNYGGLIIK